MGDTIIQDIRDAAKWRFFCKMIDIVADVFPTMGRMVPLVHYMNKADDLASIERPLLFAYMEQQELAGRIVKLEAALESFVKLFPDDDRPDDRVVARFNEHTLTLGDIRNARKALAYTEQIDKGVYDYKE